MQHFGRESHDVGVRERRRQLHFQRTFSRNVLEATVTAAVWEISPGPSLLRSFAALEKATGDLVKPATRALATIDAERARIAAERRIPQRRREVTKQPAPVNLAASTEPDPAI